MRWPALCAFISSVLLLSLARGQAGPLPAPEIAPGQYVYTIPEGFDPPLIGREGLAEIQQSARNLHYPYYVVIVEALPSELVDSSSSEEEAAARAIDGLAEDWQNQSGRYDAGKSSIFLLCYNPRQYRFLAGATWKAKLGFERSAHRPYTDIFDRSVEGTPKDPKTGIIEMMKAVDEYLFDRTDPARVAARRKAAAEAERLRRLQDAQSSLDRQLLRLEMSLEKPRAYLPANIRIYQSALDKARGVRLANDPARMLAEADSLGKSNDVLEAYIGVRESEARQMEMQRAITTVGEAIILVLVCFFALVRFMQYRRLRKAFEAGVQAWEQKLLNAKTKYADFYGNERGSVVGLSDLGGETKVFFNRVTAEIDAVYLGVEAMDLHVKQCRAAASRGSFFRVGPFWHAARDLENEFEFDTGQLDPRNLFGPPTKVIKIKPEELSRDLEQRYARTIEDWEYLKKAAHAKNRPAEELFSEGKLDEMLKVADEHGIPHAWLSDHPLFGSDEQDEAVYTGVNASRRNDPVAFMRQIDSLVAKEHEIGDRLDRLVEAINVVKSSRLEAPPQFGATVLSPQDDPRVTFESARREEERFAGLLASRGGEPGLQEVETQAGQVQKLYQSCAEQTATVQSAIEDAGKAVAQAEADQKNAEALEARADSRLSEARITHRNVGSAESSLASGRRYVDDGQRVLESSRLKLGESRHLEARRDAWQASHQFGQAGEQFSECIGQCEELDRQKARYEEKLAEMSSARRRAESRLNHYGRSTGSLREYPRDVISGPVDYYALMAVLQSVEQEWDRQIRNAQRDYEVEQTRIRREREERESRNNDSFWGGGGFGSSSGGGWGGGGSSSSGGGWSGGGSSSSGGKW